MLVYSWCICLLCYIGHEQLRRINLTYLATIIQFVVVKCQNVKRNCCKNILNYQAKLSTKLSRVLIY